MELSASRLPSGRVGRDQMWTEIGVESVVTFRQCQVFELYIYIYMDLFGLSELLSS